MRGLSKIKNQAEILRVGSPAPAFTLQAANRDQTYSLSALMSGGALVVEFLRGTW
jgi:peroxiredoxin